MCVYFSITVFDGGCRLRIPLVNSSVWWPRPLISSGLARPSTVWLRYVVCCAKRCGLYALLWQGTECLFIGCHRRFPSYNGESGERWIVNGGTMVRWSGAGLGVCRFESYCRASGILYHTCSLLWYYVFHERRAGYLIVPGFEYPWLVWMRGYRWRRQG